MAMNELNQKRGRADKGSSAAERIVVAVKAAKEIPRTAFAWALSHVAQPGDYVTLLVIVPSKRIGKRFWSFPRFSGDCANRNRSVSGVPAEMSTDIMEAFSKMVLQLNDVYDPQKIDVKVKILPGSPCGAVSAESKRIHSNWVIFDRQLRNEEKRCMAELQCNIVAMRHSQAKVLRLRLVGSHETEPQVDSPLTHPTESSEKITKKESDTSISNQGPTISSTSSPDVGASSFTGTEAGVSSFISSSDPGTSPFSVSGMRVDTINEKINQSSKLTKENSESSESDNELVCPTVISELHPWAAEILRSIRQSKQIHGMHHIKPRRETILPGKSCKDIVNVNITSLGTGSDLSIREAIPLSRNDFPGPPLCSICQHKTPVFGKPPRWFSYAELELATGGFSKVNFLAEGGFGSVYRGVLPDGQVVAVKQHKLASSQGDLEFSSEVEVLSCAQHRNVVMLIGYCAEDRRRLLVYEYVCNGSLDSHLYGQNRKPLEWSARQKIARGAARGLRYLHEECRVGCIVHRDMRPNNILITHDYEPLVGDFGLARWQPDGDVAAETRVVGTFGYLAPEYAQSGQITEKADVYSFGVVLIELVTGRKAVDMNRPKGQQCLTEWVRPMLDEFATGNLVDSRLGCTYSEQEVSCMLYAASLCIRRDPNARPRMSQVIRILDGDVVMDHSFLPTPTYNVGNQSASVQQRGQDNTGCMGSSSGRFHTGLSRTRLISYLDG